MPILTRQSSSKPSAISLNMVHTLYHFEVFEVCLNMVRGLKYRSRYSLSDS